MIGIDDGRQFLTSYAGKRIGIVPHPDADGLSGAAILWRSLQGDIAILCPEKGISIHDNEFQRFLRDQQLDALIVVDQGSRPGEILPGVPTMVIDHHVPAGEPAAVFVSSHRHHPSESASHLCYLLTGEPQDQLWLAALGAIGDYGSRAPFELVREAQQEYTQTDLLESVALINSARRSSRYNWKTAFEVLLQASNPRQIATLETPGSALLRTDRDEVNREAQRARKVRPFFADPWAVIPFSSACLVHGLVATSWLNRLQNHYVVAANFGYRPGYVHFSIRSAMDVNLIAELRAIVPEGTPGEWGYGHQGATGGAVTRSNFLLILNHMGFPVDQTVEIDDAASRTH